MRRVHLLTRAAPLLAAGLWLAVAGCGLSGLGDFEPIVNDCSRPCGTGAVCDPELRACVASTAPYTDLRLRFSLADGTTAFREVRTQSLGGAAPVALAEPIDLPQPVELAGWVGVERPDGLIEPRTARLTLSRPSALPGEPAEQVVLTASVAAAAGEPFRPETPITMFRLTLPPGEYGLYVEPEADDGTTAEFPPLASQIAVTSAATRLDVRLPPVDALRRIVGRVTRADGAPVPNLSVHAQDPDTGRRLSTVALTASYATLAGGGPFEDSDPGWFEILLPADIDRFRLVVAPTDRAQVFPTLSFDPLGFEALDLDGDQVVAFDGVERPELALPPIGLPLTFQGTVEGTASGGGPAAPVAGATLRFSRNLDTGVAGVTARFDQVAVTDSSGRIIPAGAADPGVEGMALLDGDYAVTVTPPGGGDLAGLHQPLLHVTAPPDPSGERILRGQLFALGPRGAITGFVTDLSGRPVHSVSVEVELLEPSAYEQGADPAVLNAVVGGRTDDLGAFSLRVDPGRHRVVIRPDETSYYPWTVVPAVEVLDGSHELPLDVSLEPPVVLTAAVRVGGVPAAAAVVEAFAVPAEDSSRVVPVGRALTGADGAFRLLLSPRLGQL